jgi:hypothetical protein
LAVDLDIYVEPDLSLERPVVAVQPDLEAEVLVAVPPKGDSSHSDTSRANAPVVLHGLTGLPRGVWRRPNRDGDAGGGEPFHAVAKLLSGRAGRPPSFGKFTLPVHDRPSICFKRLGA